MSEASLTRILSGGLPPSDLADWLEKATADAAAKGRCQVIAFPRLNRRATMTHKQSTTEPSLADIVLENIKEREAQAVAQQLPQLPQTIEKESGNDDPETGAAA